MKIGTRVMVCQNEDTNSAFDYADDYRGAQGRIVETDHSVVAEHASEVRLDDGRMRSFWHKHLKLLTVGRNPV